MISQISWGTFITYLSLIAGIYYIAVALIYYKQELLVLTGRQTTSANRPDNQRLSASPLGQSYDYGAIFADVNSREAPVATPAEEVSIAQNDREIQENYVENIDDQSVEVSPAEPTEETFEEIDLKDLVKYSEISS